MRVLMLDNYDSFTYNLVQYLGELGATVAVVRNDVATVEELLSPRPQGVVISPGPGQPEGAGVSIDLVRAAADFKIPVLGVCLGHQAIGVAYGARIKRAGSIMHGKVSRIEHDGAGVFEGLPENFEATRYHSLAIDRETCPEVLHASARSEDGEIMGVRHQTLPVEGVQFHPESILTEVGKGLLKNFLDRCSRGLGAEPGGAE